MAPKLGIGLYGGNSYGSEGCGGKAANAFGADNLTFAKQLGATHIVLHLPGDELLPRTRGVWQVEHLRAVVATTRAHGLQLAAIENFPPCFWDKILLGEAGRDAQMERLKTTVRNMGEAGVPVMGYCFTLTGVHGRREVEARGGAKAVGLSAADLERAVSHDPLPRGNVWGEQIEPPADGFVSATEEEMWERLSYFLRELVPVAEQAGVVLAAHPDDPPVPAMRGAAKLLYTPGAYRRLLDIVPSRFNACEFCQGTISEMAEGDAFVYETIRRYAGAHAAYVHFRNAVGAASSGYRETFIDDGDVDMAKAMEAYRDVGFSGVMIPDHTPSMTCDAPWHAGIAFAVGYMKATAKSVGYAFDAPAPVDAEAM